MLAVGTQSCSASALLMFALASSMPVPVEASMHTWHYFMIFICLLACFICGLLACAVIFSDKMKPYVSGILDDDDSEEEMDEYQLETRS
mmetsp:Transcript_6214/g.11289  ORF Transcript_6214/g.11289 Transcript_6214/m.11289 type:complete len:89 (+) Transcript_6214:144-410(+)